jgi:hypothetical protein
MRFSNSWAVPVLLTASVAAVCCWAANPAPNDEPAADATKGLVVHEWGTFSTFSGSDGTNLKFDPYDNDLPDFVYGYLPKNSKEGPKGGTISLETPVIYFYAEQALTASVRVDFPKGTLTEWYPHANRKDNRIVWPSFQVRPKEEMKLPIETKKSRYYAARETDASPLRVAFTEEGRSRTEQEKFLFYRGVGTFGMPLSVRASAGGEFTVSWNGKGQKDDLILVQVQGGKVRFQPFRLEPSSDSTAQVSVRVPDRDSTVEQLGEAMAKLLTGKGLFEKEARAMVKTWSSAWFGEEGTRLLYILPDELTDAMLPLRIEPKPASLVRALVGRHDILTPEREKQIDVLVAKLSRSTAKPDAEQRAAAQELAKLGRYQRAAWNQSGARLKGRR